MSTTHGWTPAPRAGLVPLYPFGFGTALGRSFSALRGNPKVLLGFAVGVQTIGTLAGLAIIGGVAAATFSRLDTVPQGSEDFDAILAGSTAITAIATILVSLALSAVSVIVQGVVVAEVSRAVVGERATLRQLWTLVGPAFWRLAGWFALQLAGMLALVVLVLVPLFAGAATEQWGVMLIALPLLFGMIPLWVWLGTKLYLVTPAIVLEGIGPIAGVKRSWVLTRGRFWATFGVMALINLLVGVASSVIGFPFQLLTSLVPSIVMPFGESTTDPGPAIGIGIGIAILSAALQVLVSAIGTIVAATGGALMYVDARMRREGLDLRLQSYVEQRELGAEPLPDPWAYDPSHVAPPRPPLYGGPGFPGSYPPAYGYGGPSGYGVPQAPGYGQPTAPQPGDPPTQPGYPPAQGHPPAHGYPPAQPYPPTQGAPVQAVHPTYAPPTYAPPPPAAGGS